MTYRKTESLQAPGVHGLAVELAGPARQGRRSTLGSRTSEEALGDSKISEKLTELRKN